jgi:hypothetical protein
MTEYLRPGESRHSLAQIDLHVSDLAPDSDEVREELRQLRAAISIYRHVVDRLLEKRGRK